MTKWWMVRAGSSNNLVPIWRQRGVASIGWAELGNPQGYSTREVLIQKAHEVYEDEKPPTRLNWASQVWRFSHEVELGNRVITFTKDKREYLIGTVIATHQHDIDVVSKHYPNVIGVEWEVKQIPRDDLSQGAKNSLGSTLTVFRVDDWGE